MVEIFYARLKEIQDKFDEVKELIGEDGKLKTDLESAVTQYNAFLQSLGAIAAANPTAYPDYSAADVPTFKLPEITIPNDIAQVDVKGMDYKTTWRLVEEMLADGRPIEAVLWSLFALFRRYHELCGRPVILQKCKKNPRG